MILVCGGAGYIGSHAVKQLLDCNYKVLVIDNLSTGYKENVDSRALFYNVDIRDFKELDNIFKMHKIDAVLHFAANSIVSESVKDPYKYYENNVLGSLNLLKCMKNNNILKIVFSSTAAVYGNPKRVPIEETDETIPTNPYGETKLAIEKILKWFDNAYNIKYISLRYFNVAGADKSANIGEMHNPETHLIPLVIKTALGEREYMSIFGDDYNTFDGTCIRDYIHVTDLVDAHILALEKLLNNSESNIYNLGYGEGFSVKQIIERVSYVTNSNIKVKIEKRRDGDPDILIANPNKAINDLRFKPKYNDLDYIIKSAFNWHKKFI